MAPGNPFLYRDEHDDDDFMPITTSDQDMSQNIGNDDETKQTLVVSLTVTCISVRNVMQSLKVSLVCFCTPAVSMRALCIPVTNLNTRQHIRAILKTHQQSKHDGVRYSCNQCEYQATQQGSLKTHQQFKHKCVQYFCDQCEYQAATQSSLKTHQHFKQ